MTHLAGTLGWISIDAQQRDQRGSTQISAVCLIVPQQQATLL